MEEHDELAESNLNACLTSPNSCNSVKNWRSSAQLFGVDRRWLRALVRMEWWSQVTLAGEGCGPEKKGISLNRSARA